jgi:hypothetical protein
MDCQQDDTRGEQQPVVEKTVEDLHSHPCIPFADGTSLVGRRAGSVTGIWNFP